MVEQRLFVFEQPIVTAVELVDLRQSDILAQQVGHGAALEPLAMQAPLATRRQQPVGRQEQQHLVPTVPPAFAGAGSCGSGRAARPRTGRAPVRATGSPPASTRPTAAAGTTAARQASAGRPRRRAAPPRSGLPGTATGGAAPPLLPRGRRSTCAKPVPANR